MNNIPTRNICPNEQAYNYPQNSPIYCISNTNSLHENTELGASTNVYEQLSTNDDLQNSMPMMHLYYINDENRDPNNNSRTEVNVIEVADISAEVAGQCNRREEPPKKRQKITSTTTVSDGVWNPTASLLNNTNILFENENMAQTCAITSSNNTTALSTSTSKKRKSTQRNDHLPLNYREAIRNNSIRYAIIVDQEVMEKIAKELGVYVDSVRRTFNNYGYHAVNGRYYFCENDLM